MRFVLDYITKAYKKNEFLYSLICGILFATPFMCEWLFPFTFLSLILFFYALDKKEKKQKEGKKHLFFKHSIFSAENTLFSRFQGFFLGTFLVVYTLFFKLYPFEGFDFSPSQGILIVISGWLGASFIHAFLGSAILNISKRFFDSPLIFSLAVSVLWVIFEESMSLGFLAFPWVNISVSQVKFLPFLQTASLFGNGIITLVTVFSSCLFAFYLKYPSKKSFAKISAFVLALNLVLGTVLYLIPHKEREENKENVCIVQGNVGMGDKWDSSNFYSILESHDKLIRETLEQEGENTETVLLAETVFPAVYTENGLIYRCLSKIAKDFDVTVVFGVLLNIDGIKYNAVMGIYPDGTCSDFYSKQRLVPFGEKMPSFELLEKIFPLGGMSEQVFKEGTESKIIPTHKGVLYSPLVCYDSVFPSFSRSGTKKGAEIISVSTNDSWYKDGAAVRQHQSHSVIRAIENGRYVFRSANTGISCVISSKGKIIKETLPLQETAFCSYGYALSHKTLYVLCGNTSLYFSISAIVFLLMWEIFKKNKKTSENN